MIRRVVGVLAVLTSLPLVATVLAWPGVADAPGRAEERDPLQVTITDMSSSVIPRKGTLKLSGTVTNVSDDTWSRINLYALVSDTPITTGDDLEVEARTDQVGNRIIEEDYPVTDDFIEELAPGASARYSLKLPHDVLMIYLPPTAAAGVYWLGVQALGQASDARDNTSDGRAATFIPLVPSQAEEVRAALVMPIRHSVSYNRNGRLGGIRRWARDLAQGGRLDNLLDFAAAAPPDAVTWLIDPSVLEAVRRIAAGNPPRDLGPVSDDSESPSESPEGSPSDGETTGSDGSAGVPPDNEARLAGEWLDRVVALTRENAVLGLPYGDVDMAAANDLDPQVAVRALAMSASSFEELGIDADPTVAPPSGYLNAISVAGLENDVTILASDAVLAAPPGELTENPGAVTVNEHTVHLYDASASLGGPLPNNRFADLAVRQRFVSEAALRSISHSTDPLVVSMPADWNPGPAGVDLFDALDLSWLSLVPLPSLTQLDPPLVAADDLVYPTRQVTGELDGGNFDAARRLLRAGATLQSVLSENSTVEREVTAQALTTTSYFMRADPSRAAVDAAEARRTIQRLFKRIQISAPPYVTLSSTRGRFRVDVENKLEQPVSVKIKSLVDDELEIDGPSRIAVEGNRISSVFLQVRSTGLGVHQVRLVLTDEEGTRLGPAADLPIRSSQSGRVIWVIIAVGAALLFGAIALRLFRRITGKQAG